MWTLLITADSVLYIVLIYEINLLPKLIFNRVFIKKKSSLKSQMLSQNLSKEEFQVYSFFP